MYKFSKKYVNLIRGSSVYEVAHESPLSYAENLSGKLKNEIFLKREDLQPTHSFKIRGAHNKIAHLVKTEKIKHVVTASAGNHAQGVAYSSKFLKIKSTIFMPKTTPSIKIDSVRKLGSKVVLHGNNFDEALEKSLEFCKEKNYPFIHPFDDPMVIAGQGTVGYEIIKQFSKPIYAIFVAVGGGGLISGIGAYIKNHNPDIIICDICLHK